MVGPRMRDAVRQQTLQQVRATVAQQLRHTGMNRAILVFGVLFVLLLLLIDFHSRQPFLPASLVLAIKIGILVFGAYFITAIVIRLTADLVAKLLKDAEIEHKLLVRKAYTGLIYALATLVILWKLGLSVQNLTILIGFMATGFAFAVRDVIIAFLAWYVLLIKRPFRIGDHIKIGDDEGKVMHIGTFYVLIDNSPSSRDDFIRIPGKTFLEKPVRNFGPAAPIHTAKVFVEKIPAKYDDALKRIAHSVAKRSGIRPQLSLDAEAEKTYLVATFSCGYEERPKVKEALILAVAKRWS